MRVGCKPILSNFFCNIFLINENVKSGALDGHK